MGAKMPEPCPDAMRANKPKPPLPPPPPFGSPGYEAWKAAFDRERLERERIANAKDPRLDYDEDGRVRMSGGDMPRAASAGDPSLDEGPRRLGHDRSVFWVVSAVVLAALAIPVAIYASFHLIVAAVRYADANP